MASNLVPHLAGGLTPLQAAYLLINPALSDLPEFPSLLESAKEQTAAQRSIAFANAAGCLRPGNEGFKTFTMPLTVPATLTRLAQSVGPKGGKLKFDSVSSLLNTPKGAASSMCMMDLALNNPTVLAMAFIISEIEKTCGASALLYACWSSKARDSAAFDRLDRNCNWNVSDPSLSAPSGGSPIPFRPSGGSPTPPRHVGPAVSYESHPHPGSVSTRGPDSVSTYWSSPPAPSHRSHGSSPPASSYLSRESSPPARSRGSSPPASSYLSRGSSPPARSRGSSPPARSRVSAARGKTSHLASAIGANTCPTMTRMATKGHTPSSLPPGWHDNVAGLPKCKYCP